MSAKQETGSQDFKEPVGLVMEQLFLYFMVGVVIIGLFIVLIIRFIIKKQRS
jgi:hypothetical protein